MVKNQALNCFSGKQIPCDIDSVCVHGDGKSAVGTAKEIREGLVKTGVTLRPLDQLKKFVQLTSLPKETEQFYRLFKPQLTPKKMLELGVFGGSYLGKNTKEFPKDWFKKAKLSKTFDVNMNRFKIAAGLSKKEWMDKGLSLIHI